MKKVIWLISLLVASLLLVGCARTAQEAIEKGIESETGADVELDQGKTTEGVPDEFVYPQADVTHRSTITQEEGEVVSITLTTPDSIDKVESFFDSEPAAGGWDQQAKSETAAEGSAPATSYSFAKDDTQATVTVTEDDGDTLIAINLFKEGSTEE